MDATPDTMTDVRLAGPDGPRSPAVLVDFANVLRTLRSALRHVERRVTGTGALIECEVAGLSCSSARLAAAPMRGRSDPRAAAEALGIGRDPALRLERGDPIDARLDPAAIRAFQGFSSPIGREGVRLGVGGTRLTVRFVADVRRLPEPEPSSFGSVSGRLGTLNVHGDHRLVICPPTDDQEVACTFSDEDLPVVERAFGRHVTVYGEPSCSLGKPFPVRVAIDDACATEVRPDADELPDLLDACGLLNGNNTDSVSAIGTVRDER